MPAPTRSILLEELCQRTSASLSDAIWRSEEIIIFGSRSLGVNRASSDLDVLCVGPQLRKVKNPSIDCIFLAKKEMASHHWLGSELANHVLAYGVWVEGDGLWRNNVQLSTRAVRRKEQRIRAILRNLAYSWDSLAPVFQVKYNTTIRREIQRLLLLREGEAVPPTPLLDQEWHLMQDPKIRRTAEEFCSDTGLLQRVGLLPSSSELQIS